MSSQIGDRFVKSMKDTAAKITRHPIARLNALLARDAMSPEWRKAFNDFAHTNTVDKLVLFSAALWAMQAATVIWHISLFARGLIGVGGFIGRLVFTCLYIAGITAMNSFAVKGEADAKSHEKSEYRVLLYMVAMTVGQIAFAALDASSVIAVYRLIITAVIIAMLPDMRSEKTIATTGALYTAICAAVILIPGVGEETPLSHLPAVVISVAGAEFVCLFVRSHVITTFIHQKTTEEANEQLEATNRKLLSVNESLEKLSTTDQLTQVPNRRAFDAYMSRVWSECRRLHKPLSVLMMDIDHFKAFNDFYGHVEGDECLKTVAESGRKHFNRAVDLFARYGGEEFVAVLPFTSAEAATRLAEATRADVESLRVPNPHSESGPYVTLSLGCATMLPDGDDPSVVVERADKALYEAKESGRNRVVVDGEDNAYLAHAKVAEAHEEFEALRAELIKKGAAAFVIDLVSETIAFSKEFLIISGVHTTTFTLEGFLKYLDTVGAATFRDFLKHLREDTPTGNPRFMFISPDGRLELTFRAMKFEADGFEGQWVVGVICNENEEQAVGGGVFGGQWSRYGLWV